MSLQKKKPRICKCGHNREEHIKQPKKFFSAPGQCNKCQCSEYLNRKRPDKGDLFILIASIIITGFILVPVVDVWVIEPLPQEKLHKQISISEGTLLSIMSGILIIGGLIFGTYMITPYFTAKKRKEFPIEGEDN